MLDFEPTGTFTPVTRRASSALDGEAAPVVTGLLSAQGLHHRAMMQEGVPALDGARTRGKAGAASPLLDPDALLPPPPEPAPEAKPHVPSDLPREALGHGVMQSDICPC